MKWFKNVLVQTGLRAGIISGVVSVFLFLVLYSMGIGIMDELFRIDFMIPLPFLIFSLYFFRKRWEELRIWQGLILGAVTVYTSLLIYLVFVWVFVSFIDVDFLEKSIGLMIDKLNGLKQDMINTDKYNQEYKEEFLSGKYAELVGVAKQTTLSSIMWSKFIWHMIAGTIYSVFMSLLFRK